MGPSMRLSRFASPTRLALAALAAGVVTSSACAVNDLGANDEAIIGGAAAPGVEHIGIVYFNPTFVCTGFLVSPNVVMTAAHCFNGGRVPVAFYTGDGAPVATPEQVPGIPGLTRHAISSSGRHPAASTVEAGQTNYVWQYDVAYVVLQTPLTIAPLAYGAGASVGQSCTIIGYGLDGAIIGQGTGGLRRRGTATIASIVSNGSHPVISLHGHPQLASRGDSGGPLICNGKAEGVFSWVTWDESGFVNGNQHVGIAGNVKTWLDGVVATNAPPPPPPIDAGVDAELPDAGPGGGQPATDVMGGCAAGGGGAAWLAGALAALGLITTRRRRASGAGHQGLTADPAAGRRRRHRQGPMADEGRGRSAVDRADQRLVLSALGGA